MRENNQLFTEKNKTVCFSGHRPEKLPDSGNDNSQIIRMLKSLLYKEIIDCIEQGYNCFVTGLARGVDLWAGEIILEQKSLGRQVSLIAAVPYREHGKSFKDRDKFTLGNILSKADEIVYVSESYSKNCMRLRNEYMINRSGKLIAVVSDYKSGTGQTIRYAQKQGIEVKIIDAAKFESAVSSASYDDSYEQLVF